MPNKTLSLTDDAYNFIMNFPGNKSEFVSKLIESYYTEENSTDPEKLLIKKKELVKDIEIRNLKIKQLDEEINSIKDATQKAQYKKDKENALADFKREHDEFNERFKNGDIEEEDYWEGVDARTLEKENLLKDLI